MNCLPCFNKDGPVEATDPQPSPLKKDIPAQIEPKEPVSSSSSKAKTFTFRELAVATKNFRQECLLGEGGFGRVFKGKLQSSGQVVAVKQLDRNGMQGNKEFLVEVLKLSLIQHTNLISLIGYCADGDQRLLVYEYLQMGSLENLLLGDDPDKKPMDWYTRMKIALGAAKGLEYLHDKANPPIIYRDLKPSNILLDENYEPKLSDYGLAKIGGGGNVNPTSRVMGTYGYSAPEYSSGGELTLKSDIYSFGVVLLELLTGRKAIDTTRPNDEQNLVTWAQPIFREPKLFSELADPRLNKEFPLTSLNQAVGICAMCLQEEPSVRPLIGDVVAALSFLAIPQPSCTTSPKSNSPPSEQKMLYDSKTNQNQQTYDSARYDGRGNGHSESSQCEDGSGSDQRKEGSPRQLSAEDKDSSSRFSEEQNMYTSGSDSGGGNTNYGDAETTELEDPESSVDSISNYSLHSAQNTGSSMRSDAGHKSSEHGSSRSSSTKNSGSRRRNTVVTFREPSLCAKNKGTRKPDGENSHSDNNDQTVLPAATDGIQLVEQPSPTQLSSSSLSSESSSESEDEKGSPRHEKDPQFSPQNNGR